LSIVKSLSSHLGIAASAAACVLLAAVSADAALRHRYSFSEGTTADASNRTIIDSKGGANGVVRGAGASATAGELVLPGGSSATQAYVDLPNGLVSKFNDATFEAWYTISSTQAWTRVFDFGSTVGPGGPGTDGMELTGPGGGGEGQDYIFFAPFRGTDINAQRAGMRNNDPLFGAGGSAGTVAGAEAIIDPENPTMLNVQQHVIVSFDADGAGPGMHTLNLWLNGVRPPGEVNNPRTTTISLKNLNDVNNWLGRSNWTFDANFGGSFNEFRIYDVAFDNGMAAISFANGPNGAIVPEPATVALFVAAVAGGLLALRRKFGR
jgi:hypothetical protein